MSELKPLFYFLFLFKREPKLFIVKIAILESYKNAPRLRKQLEIILGGVFISSQWWLQISNILCSFFWFINQYISSETGQNRSYTI